MHNRHGIAAEIAAALKPVKFAGSMEKIDYEEAFVTIELTPQRLYLDTNTPSLREHVTLRYTGLAITVEMPLQGFVGVAVEHFKRNPLLPASGCGDTFHGQLFTGWHSMLERIHQLERMNA